MMVDTQIHHCGGAAALLATLASGQCHLYGLLLLSTEVTTPFICMRWMLDKAAKRKTQLYIANAVAIFLGWVFCRILLFIYLFIHMWESRAAMAVMPIYVQVCDCMTAWLSALGPCWIRV